MKKGMITNLVEREFYGGIKKAIVFFYTLLLIGSANANPVLDNVASGNVNIQQSQGSTVVQQSSQQAIINWHSFNINSNEQTHFYQPTGGVALNRIDPSQGASQIYGVLTATGQIILINQAGIYFGPTAHVDVGSIIASTANITDANFLAGKYIFDQASAYNGSIINAGTIIAAQNGLVALVGSNVTNQGMIQANVGTVILASGKKFTVDLIGDQLINFSVDDSITQAGVDQNSKALKTGVSNSGSVIADDGKIIMSARAAASVLDNVIDMSGVAQARSVYKQNSEIILSGGENGKVHVSGKLDASGRVSGHHGENITVTGQSLFAQGTTLDVSGDQGGGDILFGGNFHGQGPLPNAMSVYVDPISLFIADAITKGDGGQVAVWSNGSTQFYGGIFARAGAQGGNGGYVETSGGYLDINGARVNTLAPMGQTGTWLLDPTDITITSSADSNATYLNGTYQPTSGASNSSTISVSNLITDLASSNVLVTTSAFSGSGGAGNGDITVSSAITWATTNTLTLSAYRNIAINAAISNSAGGGLSLIADNTGTGTGTISGLQNGGSGSLSFTGNNSVVKAYYNATSFGTQDGSLGSGIFKNVTVSGAGSSFTPYMLVNSQTNLQNINSYLSGNFALSKSLSLTGSFTPLGNSTTAFTGNFDGQNYVINNLSINGGGGTDIGFFGSATNATIQNIIFTNSFVTTAGANYVGTLAGSQTGGTISNVQVIDTTFPAEGSAPTQGVYDSSGGLAISGLVGQATGTVTNSSFTGAVANSGNAITSGLIGKLFGTLSNSYSAGLVEMVGNANYTAGLAGQLVDGTITNSYSTANIWNTANNIAGGLVGSATSAGIIQNSYWAGTYVKNGGGSTNNFGGILGRSSSTTLSNNFWDTTLSGIANGVGTGGGTGGQAGTTGRTTAQLQSSSDTAYTTLNSNTANTWSIISGFVYPFLQADTIGITGTITGNSGATVSIANNGANLSTADYYTTYGKSGSTITSNPQVLTTTTGSNGTYYYLLNKYYVPASTPLLLYSSSSAGSSTALVILANDSNPATVNLAANTINIHAPSLTVNNALLGVEKGSLASANILYSTSGTNLTVSGSAALTTDSTTTYSVDGSLTGSSGALTFKGPVIFNGGNVTSSGAQSYQNTINLNADANLSGSDINATSAATININGHALTLTNTDTIASNSILQGVISGTGSLTKAGLGSLTFSDANTYTGATTINAGTILADNNSAFGMSTVTVNGATLAVNDGVTLSNILGLNLNNATVTGQGTEAISPSSNGITLISGTTNIFSSASGGTLTLNATIDGAAALNLQGLGTIKFSGNVGATTALTSLTANTALVINTGTIKTVNNQTYNSTVTMNHDATMSILGDGNFTFPTTVNGSNTLTIAGSGSSAGSLILPSGKSSTLVINGVGQGYINDPIVFSGFNTFVGSSSDTLLFDVGFVPNYLNNTAKVSGANLQFVGIQLPSASSSTATLQTISAVTTSSSSMTADVLTEPVVITNPVTNNVDDILQNQINIDNALKDDTSVGCI